jgi:hypothetical protein
MTSVKKVLGCLNALTQEAKLETVEKIHLFLKDKLDGVSAETLDKLLFEFRDTVSTDPDLFSAVKTKSKPKQQRPPTAYNLFIKEQMEILKKDQPGLPNTQLMSLAASKWNEHKTKLAEASGTEAPAVVAKKVKKVAKKVEKAT